jgi:hypothetical protein
MRRHGLALFVLAGAAPAAAMLPGTVAKPHPTFTAVPPPIAAGTIKLPAKCSPLALRDARAQNITPDLIGCNYADIQGGLKAFTQPASPIDRAPDASAAGLIFRQSPLPGQPSDGPGTLHISVSTGPAPPPTDTPTEQPTPPPTDAPTVAPTDQPTAPPSKPHHTPTPVPSYTYAPDPNADRIIFPPGTVAIWTLGALAIAWVLWRILRRPWPVPAPPSPPLPPSPPPPLPPVHFTCEIEPHTSRLEATGPLVLEPHLGLSIELEPGTAQASDISIVQERLVP